MSTDPDRPDPLGTRPISRRGALAAGIGAGLGGLGLAAGSAFWLGGQDRFPDLELYAEGVGIRADGSRTLIPVGAGDSVGPGSRVLAATATPGARAQRRAELEWLLSGSVPGATWVAPGRWAGRWSDLAIDALLDLRTLLLDGGALVAGWPSPWRFVWPRDASFAAAALSAAGHGDDAASILGFLQRMQRPDGLFEARYQPDGSGPPDDRGVQRDGSGWVLWAVREVARSLPPDQQLATFQAFGPMIDLAASAAVLMTRTATGLPEPSRDYWEVVETTTTLGIAAPVLAGLRAADWIYATQGRTDRRRAVVSAAGRLQAAVRKAYGPAYGRDPGSRRRDAAVTFLCPPLGVPTGSADAGRLAAARHVTERALRGPGGGLVPGTGWREDGASWTPETALFALAAAGAGETGRAGAWLDWLAAHRTGIGALPEKVIAGGAPAGPAPLAWTASLVLLTLQHLDDPLRPERTS